MSPDETNNSDLVQRLASLKPTAGSVDPRVAFYNMGFAAGSPRKNRRNNKWRKLPACDSENASWKLTPRQEAVNYCSNDPQAMEEQTKNPTTRLTVGWLTTATAVAVCMAAAFLTGYSFKPDSGPDRLNVAAGDSRLSLRESSEERTFGGAKDVTQKPLDPKPFPSPIDPAYPRSRAEMLSAGLQNPWTNRELNAYGVSNLQRSVPNRTERNSDDQKTFVSTLTRMDYLNWEDSL